MAWETARACSRAARVEASMMRAGGEVVHALFDLDARLRDGKLLGQGGDQHGRGFQRIRYLLAPGGIRRPCLIVQPDLDRIAVVFFADGSKQVGVARPARSGLRWKRVGLHAAARRSCMRQTIVSS